MAPSITIIRYPYEEPYHVHLLMVASNGRLRGCLEIYANAGDLPLLADKLVDFPRHVTDVHMWELGSERREDRFAFYFRLRLFVTDSSGHCAIQLRFNNNQDVPQSELSDFCIATESSELNRLGLLLREFAKLEHEVLHWTGAEGRLYQTRDQAQQEGDILEGM
jgi:hypothetical protein